MKSPAEVRVSIDAASGAMSYVPAMTSSQLQVGAVAAIAGAVGQAVAWALEPDWDGPPEVSARLVAGSQFWNGDRLLDLLGVLLTITALAVVGVTFRERAANYWAQTAQPLLAVWGALSASAILTGAMMKDSADAFADAADRDAAAHLAAFHSAAALTETLFFGAFLAMSLYLASLALAILGGGPYGRWIGWTALVAATLIGVGDLAMLIAEVAFLAVAAGFAVTLVVMIALGMSMWRRAVSADTTATQSDSALPGLPVA
jgi:hypothetical protein